MTVPYADSGEGSRAHGPPFTSHQLLVAVPECHWFMNHLRNNSLRVEFSSVLIEERFVGKMVVTN